MPFFMFSRCCQRGEKERLPTLKSSSTQQMSRRRTALTADQSGYRSGPISVAIARDVLSRVREGVLSESFDSMNDEKACQ